MCVDYTLMFCLSHFPFQSSYLHCLSAFGGFCFLFVMLVGNKQASFERMCHWGNWEWSGGAGKICAGP